tara:strand:- start:5265 stop:5483 length:219 start_codon:yes stop_codon:yes gene_type:complete
MKKLKHLNVTHKCKACKLLLFNQKLITEVPEDFKLSDLSEQVLENVPNLTCAEHPTAFISTSYTFYHEEILN